MVVPSVNSASHFIVVDVSTSISTSAVHVSPFSAIVCGRTSVVFVAASVVTESLFGSRLLQN